MSLEKLIDALSDMELVDLGQTLEDHMPVHPTHSRFFKMLWHSPDFGDCCTDYQLVLNEHNGTHVDSFRHYINQDGYAWIDEIPLERFSAPCVTIDATFLGACEVLTKEQIQEWEQKNGAIRAGDAVLIDTGWMSRWAVRPNDTAFTHDYPGLSGEGAAYLVERGAAFVGIDTLGIDCWGAHHDPAHQALLSSRVPVVENLNNLGLLHGRRGYFVMLPLKIRAGSASPVRPVVLVDRKA